MKINILALAVCLLSSGLALAQTTPAATNNNSTTRTANTVGFGGTISGNTQPGSTAAGTAAFDNTNAPAAGARTTDKSMKHKKDKRGDKMKTGM